MQLPNVATIREIVEDDARKALGLSAGTCSALFGPATEGHEISWRWYEDGSAVVEEGGVAVRLRLCVQIEGVEALEEG